MRGAGRAMRDARVPCTCTRKCKDVLRLLPSSNLSYVHPHAHRLLTGARLTASKWRPPGFGIRLVVGGMAGLGGTDTATHAWQLEPPPPIHTQVPLYKPLHFVCRSEDEDVVWCTRFFCMKSLRSVHKHASRNVRFPPFTNVDAHCLYAGDSSQPTDS
jgi:hypothetical protein